MSSSRGHATLDLFIELNFRVFIFRDSTFFTLLVLSV